MIITDTAGMRETLDPVEAEGVAVAHETAQQADLVLSVTDCTTLLPALSTPTMDPGSLHQMPFEGHPNVVTVLNKADVLSVQQRKQLCQQQLSSTHAEMSIQADTAHSQQPVLSPTALSSDHKASEASASQATAPTQNTQAPSASVLVPVQNVEPLQAVLCSCRTGWNMEMLVSALEQGARSIMESGQNSQEELVITRYSMQSQTDTVYPTLAVLYHAMHYQAVCSVLPSVTLCSAMLCSAVLCPAVRAVPSCAMLGCAAMSCVSAILC